MLALLRACCRPHLTDAQVARIGERLASADGARLAQLARRHRVEGLAWRTMKRTGVVPLGLGMLAQDARRIADDGLLMATECGRLHRTFARASLPHLFLKGPALSALAWNDATLSRQRAIDLLVPAGAIGKAANLLASLGYVQQWPEPSVDPVDWHRSHKSSLWRSDDGVLLVLAGRVAEHRALLPTVTAASQSQMVVVGEGIDLPTLTDRLLLPTLAVQGWSKAWSRLAWLADFAALVGGIEADQLASIADQAPRLGAGRSVAAALVLANRVFGAPLPRELEFDGGSKRLVKIGLAALSDSREPAERRFGNLRIAHAQLLMKPGSHYFMSEAVRQLGRLLTR